MCPLLRQKNNPIPFSFLHFYPIKKKLCIMHMYIFSSYIYYPKTLIIKIYISHKKWRISLSVLMKSIPRSFREPNIAALIGTCPLGKLVVGVGVALYHDSYQSWLSTCKSLAGPSRFWEVKTQNSIILSLLS